MQAFQPSTLAQMLRLLFVCLIAIPIAHRSRNQIFIEYAWAFFCLVFMGIIGAGLGTPKRRTEAGFWLGALLGPLGWILVLVWGDKGLWQKITLRRTRTRVKEALPRFLVVIDNFLISLPPQRFSIRLKLTLLAGFVFLIVSFPRYRWLFHDFSGVYTYEEFTDNRRSYQFELDLHGNGSARMVGRIRYLRVPQGMMDLGFVSTQGTWSYNLVHKRLEIEMQSLDRIVEQLNDNLADGSSFGKGNRRPTFVPDVTWLFEPERNSLLLQGQTPRIFRIK